jgi:hypothetical protein
MNKSPEINIYCPSNPGDRLTVFGRALSKHSGITFTTSSIIGMDPRALPCLYGEADGGFKTGTWQLAWVAGWLVVPL